MHAAAESQRKGVWDGEVHVQMPSMVASWLGYNSCGRLNLARARVWAGAAVGRRILAAEVANGDVQA